MLTTAEKPKASRTAQPQTWAFKAGRLGDAHGQQVSQAYPMSPPIRQRTMASTETAAGSQNRGPTAFRRPISRVRSETDTSMMFIIPMPRPARNADSLPPDENGHQRTHLHHLAFHDENVEVIGFPMFDLPHLP